MRMLRRIILVVAPATAQRYDPRYPVCFQKWGEGGFTAIDCSYTSLDQCRMTASGRSAMCYANPYWPRAHQASPGAVHLQRGRRLRYGFFRQLIDLGHGSTVAAPLPIACKPGERIKTD